MPCRPITLDASSRAELLELWTSGATAGEIAHRFGVSPQVVYRWSRDYDLPLRGRSSETPTQEEIAIRAAEVRATWGTMDPRGEAV